MEYIIKTTVSHRI